MLPARYVSGYNANMASARESIIELGAKIQALRIEQQRIRQELREAEAEFDRLIEEVTSSNSTSSTLMPPPPPPWLVQSTSDISMAQRIIDILGENPAKVFTAEDVQQALGGGELPSIRSALARLFDNGRIVRHDRGIYCAKAVDPETQSSAV